MRTKKNSGGTNNDAAGRKLCNQTKKEGCLRNYRIILQANAE
ncbi:MULTISPECIES: hypothetical protein [unclassified Peribacillus]|nr:hypothetical protein [Peribacillus sp. Bi96]